MVAKQRRFRVTLQGVWDVRAVLLDACAAALAVAAGIMMQFELRLTGTYGVLSSTPRL